MFAASGNMDADITAVECFLQDFPQAQRVVVRRPVQLLPIGGTVDLERESAAEREIGAGPATAVPVTALFRKSR